MATLQDAFGRGITYLRVSLTDRCNYRCLYCMPQSHAPEFLPHEGVLTYEEMETLLGVFAELGVSRVRLTGGEPLARRGAVPFIERVLRKSWFADAALSTNGHLFAPHAARLRKAGLRRVNISLDTLDAEKFRMVTGGGDVEAVKAAIDAALREGYDPVKINCVLLRGVNDGEIARLARFALERGAHMRFIELMPVGGDGFFGPERCYPLADARAELEHEFRLTPLARGPEGAGPAHYVSVEGHAATLGFIGALTCNFCSLCNRMRLSSEGKLYPCLDHDDVFVNLRDPLRARASRGDVAALVFEALRVKPEQHTMAADRERVSHRSMSAVGG